MQLDESAAADPTALRIRDGFSVRASHEQARLWFLAQKAPEDTSYNMAYRLAIRGEAKADAIEEALHGLQGRHEILRTTFELSDGEVRQIVRPQLFPTIDRIDLSSSPEGERDALAQALALEIARQPFDLAAGPLMRCRVIRLSPDATWLVVVIHHIIGDGWSHAVLTRDFCAFYNEAAGGAPATRLPEMAIQFGDFAEWQKANQSSADLERQVAFWVDRLDGVPDLSLPCAGEGPADALAAKLRFGIEPGLLETVTQFARERRLLLSTLWLTACQRALAAMSEQDEYLMGTVVANRPLHDLENLIGFFANTIAIPSVVRQDEPTDVQLARMQALLLDVQENQQAPFDAVIDRLRHQRLWHADSPIGALFVLQNAPHEAIRLAGASVEVERVTAGAAKFPFTLFVTEASGGAEFEIEYATSRLSAAQVEGFSRSYLAILAELVGAPAGNDAGEGLLLRGERRPDWLGATVVDLIWQAAALTPGAPALADGDQRWTHAELIADAEGFAADLLALGLAPGATVMTVLPRSGALMVAILGILRAGLTWCPADPDAPDDYVAQLIGSARPVAVLSSEPLRGDLHWVRPPVRGATARASPEAAFPAPAGDAYLFHTSGSTGTPKGVVVAHEGLANVCRWIQHELDLKPGDRGLWKTAVTFDAVCRELFPILIGGGELVVGPPDAQRDMRLLMRMLHDEAVSVFHCVPSQLRGLAGEGRFPASLRAIMSGGEALDAALASSVLAANALRLYNVYGPTEATVDVTCYRVQGDEPAGPLPIGKPIPNVDLAIVRGDAILPAGFRGELFVTGVQVARGYVGPDPAGSFRSLVGHGHGYATGDLAFVRSDGNIVYEGRGDRQLKFNGVRIEPAMIEATLRQHPGVDDAHVALVDAAGAGTKIVALVTPAADADSTTPSIPVAGWSDVFEDSYADLDYGVVPADNTHGWLDSSTRAPIPLEEVLDAIEQAARRILHWRPRRILELGCGIGTLGFRLLPHCEAYRGVDFSERAIAYARHHAAKAGFGHAAFDVGAAADYAPPPGERFDAIVLNSVVQYMADPAALAALLDRLVSLLRPGGFLFVGDVRDRRLDELFAFWKVRQRASAADTCASVRLSARIDALNDDELRLAPAFFSNWAAVLGFAPPLVQVKTARGDNELVRFRYDVILTPAAVDDAAAPVQAREMINGLVAGEAALYRAVAAAAPGCSIRSVLPAGTVADLPTPRDALDRVDPADRAQLHLCLAGAAPDRFILAAVPAGASLAACCRAAGEIAGPDRADDAESDAAVIRWKDFLALQPALMAHLADHLPANMLPQHLVPLPAMPLRANGKRDLATLNLLAAKSQSRATGRRDLPEPGSVAALVAGVFGELLGRTFYLDDNFFFSGGHSLLATQARNRLEQALGQPVPLRDLFEHPTPRQLAHALTAARDGQAQRAEAIGRRPEGTPLEASHAQRRLWFIERLGTGTPIYNIAQAVRVNGPVDLDRLDQAIGELCRRHAALRSTFAEQDGMPVVQLLPPRMRGNLEIVGPPMDEAAILQRLDEAQRVRFDLTRGPLIRVIAAPTIEGHTILCLICHHIVSDGWSMGVALSELSALYDAAVAGRPAALPPVAIDYFDVAAHDRGAGRTGRHASQIGYWTRQLADAPERLALPYDRVPAGRRTWAGDKIRFDIPADVAAGIRRLSQEAGVTDFMTLLAAFNVLLRILSAQDDMVVGTVVANRNRQESEGLVGFLVNPLALRLRGDADTSFRDLLGSTRRTCIEAFENQDVPFEVLLQHLQIDRNADYQAVFQVLFAMQNAPSAEMRLGDLPCERLRLPAVGAMFDLSLELSDRGDGMAGELEYSSELFAPATAARIVANYLQTLRSCLAEPERRIGDIDVIAPPERETLDAFAAGPKLVPIEGDTLVGRLYAAAQRHPRRPALVETAGEIDFGRLARLSASVADALERTGCGIDDRVAVLLPRGSLAALGMLGCQWLGAVPCYVDPALPAGRRAALLQACGARWCLVEASPLTGASLPAWCVAVPVSLDAPQDEGLPLPPPRARPVTTAFATFTSGTTGEPKLVAVSHAAICARLQANDLLFGDFTDRDRFAHCYSFNYDGGIVCLYWPLTRGAPVVFVDLAVLGDAAALARAIAQQAVTVIDSIPAVISSLYAPDVADGLKGVRLVLTGGDTCPPDLAERHFGYSEAPIANQYGPCEAVINATTALYTRDMAVKTPMTIGRPIAGCTVAIADAVGRIVPIGVPGELWIGGPYLADGYLNAPEATHEKFQKRRMGRHEGRFYRSGDCGRWLPSGEIEFMGRVDRQIQINGMRVEPGEIERTIYEHPGVEFCRVSRLSAGASQSLVAFVVAQPASLAGALTDQWEQAFDALYLPACRDESPVLDFTGWTDTASGDPIPVDQMTEWLDDIVRLIGGLAPRRVLEVGAGLGLIALSLAGRTQEYVATDISERAVEALARKAEGLGFASLTATKAGALEVASMLAGRSFDVIVVNSLAQYMSSIDELGELVRSLVPLLSEDGHLFIGDVRDYRLREAFYRQVVEARHAGEGDPLRLERMVAQARMQDEELHVAPHAFVRFARENGLDERVAIRRKPVRFDNELVNFRYDALLSRRAAAGEALAERNWSPSVQQSLLADAIEVPTAGLRLNGVPFLIAGRRGAAMRASALIELIEDARAKGRQVELAVGDELERCDVIVHPGDSPPRPLARLSPLPDSAPLANVPTFGAFTQRLREAIATGLRQKLPAHMVPATFVILDQLPMRAGGKVDERLLTAMVTSDESDRGANGRDDLALSIMTEIWRRLIGVDEIPPRADFFSFGGHSLLAAKLVAAIAREFQVDLPVIRVFELRTLERITAATLARRRNGHASSEAPAADETVEKLVRNQRAVGRRNVALAPQDRHLGMVLRLRRPLDPRRLEDALAAVEDRHPILGWRFKPEGGLAGEREGRRFVASVPPDADVAALLARPLDTRVDGVLAFDAIKDAAGAATLVLRASALVFDGTSIERLLREVLRELRGAPRAPVSVPEGALTYAEWVAAEQRLGPAGSPPTGAVPRAERQRATTELALSATEIAVVERFAERYTMTVPPYLLGAFASALVDTGFASAPMIDCAVSDRLGAVAALAGAIGPFASDAPLRFEGCDPAKPADYYDAAADRIVGLVAGTSGAVDEQGAAPFGFSYRLRSAEDLRLLDIDVAATRSPPWNDLKLSVLRGDGALMARFSFDPLRFDPASVVGLRDRFGERILHG
ncbi:condensation domain-containing protein [Sphingomonas molluscorum]|uniref:condensation domain-containing protein n=1 Tax=Sphingomonas molluscorum TaxID=418184 RepID=UPI0031DC43A9